MYSGLDFRLTNVITIRVGEQLPYLDNSSIPGIIEPGNLITIKVVLDKIFPILITLYPIMEPIEWMNMLMWNIMEN